MTKSPLRRVVLFLALSTVSVVGYLFLLSVFRGKLGAFSAAFPAMLLAFAALILNWRFFRSEGGSLVALGFDAPLLRIRQAAIGFVGGCLLVGVWVFVVRAVAPVSWRMTPAFEPSAAAGAVTFALFNNAGEELIYRGYLFLLLARSYGRAVAVIGTSVLFALLHIQGGVPLQSAIAGVLTSALILAALFVRWQSLPLVLSFHVALNVMQELLGLRMSGLTLFVPADGSKLSGSQLNAVLALTAFVNGVVALALFVSAHNHRKRAGATAAG